MAKTVVHIEYDDQERVASVSINGGPSSEWTAAKLELTSETIEEFVRGGWAARSLTGQISLRLDGALPSRGAA